MNAKEALAQIRASGKRFYVYILKRPDGTPFYVGIGTGRRLLDHKYYAAKARLNSHKLSIIRKILASGEDLEFDIDCHSDARLDVELRERDLISKIGRSDLKLGPLANNTDGGEGAYNPSPDELLRRGAVIKAQWVGRDRSVLGCLRTPEAKAKSIEARRGRPRRPPKSTANLQWTEDRRRKQSDYIKINPVSSKPGVGAKISAAKLGKPLINSWMKTDAGKAAFARAKHPRARLIEVEGRRFECIEDAAEAFNLSRSAICNWLNRGQRGAKFL